MSKFATHKFEEILTPKEDSSQVLRTPTKILTEEDWHLVDPATKKLFDVRNTVLKGGAGLAAPQIGLSLPIFIYTPDRTTENLRAVINPSFEAQGSEQTWGAEACFSVPMCCTTLPRWDVIKVRFQNPQKEWVEETLDGFAAKVFQHEMDHLRGKLTIDTDNADVITFTNPEEFETHMKAIHQEDSKFYKKG